MAPNPAPQPPSPSSFLMCLSPQHQPTQRSNFRISLGTQLAAMSLMSGFFSSRPEMRDPASLCEVCFRMWFGPLSVLPANQARLIKIYFPKEAPEVLGKRLFCVHQPSATDLHESSQSGCHCCMLIWHHAFEDREDILTKLSAKHPIILYTEKASSAEYDMLWMPGNGTRMEISRGGKHYGNLRFLRLSCKCSLDC